MTVMIKRKRWKRDGGGSNAGTSLDSSGLQPVAADNGGYDPAWNGVQLQAGSEGSHVDTSSSGLADIGAVTLGVICGTAAAIVLAIIALLVWIRARRKRNKLLHDLTFDDCGDDAKNSRSAPPSRSPSPKLTKRMSCPEALASTPSSSRGMMVRSVTSDGVPDFTLPPERVQPDREKSGSISSQGSASGSGGKVLGSIKPDLYHHQSFSEDDEPNLPETSHGRIWYSLVYDTELDQLTVTLIKVKDLPGRGPSNQPRDPFVKIFLLPDERTYKTSKVKKKTLNPIFNESHTFQVSEEDVNKRVLRFSVYDVDRRRVRHSCGHVMINLKNLDLTKGDVMWSDLEPTVQSSSSLGDLQFTLVYLPANEKVKIAVHRAKNISFMDEYHDTGAYIRIQLYYGHKCHRIKRTLTQQAGPSIFFNESLSFSIHGRQLDSCNMVISIMFTSPRQGPNHDVEYGRVTLGSFMYARGEELVHWQEMLSQPKSASTHWHPIVSPVHHNN